MHGRGLRTGQKWCIVEDFSFPSFVVFSTVSWMVYLPGGAMYVTVPDVPGVTIRKCVMMLFSATLP